MNHYDLSVLNDKEFEEFARDVFQFKYNLELQTFKSGKDNGIDLRYSSESNNNSIVVQVKHYLRSGYTKLFNKLRKEEFPKIENLNPDSYWIFTSVSLTPNNKDQITSLFKPYIRNCNNILGLEDINIILGEFPDIERKWFKLWISSTNVLRTILNNAVHGRSAFIESQIKNSIQHYVFNTLYNDANDILFNFKYIILTGLPGVGKTTLANMLVYKLLAKGFELIYMENIRDAEDLFSTSSEKKQIFYFDDFLGSNYFDLKHPKSSESSIVTFINRITDSNNKYLILTSRTTILNSAVLRYDKFRSSNLDIAKREIKLDEYSSFDKALILYNHLYHSNLNEEFVENIFSDKNYWKIIEHKNYNPRFIDYFTKSKNLKNISSSEYLPFILENLDNPHKIWEHSFLYQIENTDRYLLFILFSLGGECDYNTLENVYINSIGKSAMASFILVESDSFNTSIKRLSDGYLLLNKTFEKLRVKFVNPSVNDYLIYFIENSSEERSKLIESMFYIEQFEFMIRLIYNINISHMYFSLDAGKIMNLLLARRDSILSTSHPKNAINEIETHIKYLKLVRICYSEYKIYGNFNTLIYSLFDFLNGKKIHTLLFDDCIQIISSLYIPKVIKEEKLDSMISLLISGLELNNEFRIYHVDIINELYKSLNLSKSGLLKNSYIYNLFVQIVERQIDDKLTKLTNVYVNSDKPENLLEGIADKLTSIADNTYLNYGIDPKPINAKSYITKAIVSFSDNLLRKRNQELDDEEDSIDYPMTKTEWSSFKFVDDDDEYENQRLKKMDLRPIPIIIRTINPNDSKTKIDNLFEGRELPGK